MYNDQPSKTTNSVYISYLMRLWRSAGNSEWLASLEAPGTHERHSFSDLASFFAFLQAETGSEQSTEAATGDKETSRMNTEPP